MDDRPAVDTNDRQSLICWLVWNDRNGCYTDEDAMAEWGQPHALATLRNLYVDQIAEGR